jgi:hypothetical protein
MLKVKNFTLILNSFYVCVFLILSAYSENMRIAESI